MWVTHSLVVHYTRIYMQEAILFRVTNLAKMIGSLVNTLKIDLWLFTLHMENTHTIMLILNVFLSIIQYLCFILHT